MSTKLSMTAAGKATLNKRALIEDGAAQSAQVSVSTIRERQDEDVVAVRVCHIQLLALPWRRPADGSGADAANRAPLKFRKRSHIMLQCEASLSRQ
eukprot:8133170-Pyramimonas_sp.AAC.1